MRKIFGVAIFLLGMLTCYLVQAVMGAAARPDPNVAFKDWTTLIFASAALLASLAALNFNKKKAKQDAFLGIHEKLIALDIQEGRRLLFEKVKSPNDAGALLAADPSGYHKINRALAMYDVLALYVKRGYVSKSWVMEEWGANLAKARTPGLHFIAHRMERGVPSNWSNFKALSLEARIKYQVLFASKDGE